MLDNGHGPIMVEGVQATLTVAGRPVQAVNVLDQDGRRQPGRTVPAGAGGRYALDTARDKTLYYEIVFR